MSTLRLSKRLVAAGAPVDAVAESGSSVLMRRSMTARIVFATDADFQIADLMQQYWTNFAKTGDPNGGNLPKWPRFDVATRAYLQFTGAGPVTKEGLRGPFCDLFIQNISRNMTR